MGFKCATYKSPLWQPFDVILAWLVAFAAISVELGCCVHDLELTFDCNRLLNSLSAGQLTLCWMTPAFGHFELPTCSLLQNQRVGEDWPTQCQSYPFCNPA